MVLVDEIVNACVELYKTISKMGKPTEKEWTVISAIVAVFNSKDIKVLSLGTGSKCIGQTSMSPLGDILNDSHAEVIARRAFLKYLYYEIMSFYNCNISEIFIQDNNILSVKDSVKFYFVTSMSPCGDASIIPMAKNYDSDNTINFLKRRYSTDDVAIKKLRGESEEEKIGTLTLHPSSDIYRTGAKCLPNSSIQDSHLPGVLYHSVGVTRTKPGRGDPTLSLSCSDKIARWNAVGWQGALLSLFINKPIFMDGIICGGGCPFSKDSFDRAVNGRINSKVYVPIWQSNISFPYNKASEKKPSPLSIIWCRLPSENVEVSVNGWKQGVTKKNFHKKKARTSICKKEFLLLFESVMNSLPNKVDFVQSLIQSKDINSFKSIKYGELKYLAKEYQSKWQFFRNKHFLIWSRKPNHLLNFSFDDEK